MKRQSALNCRYFSILNLTLIVSATLHVTRAFLFDKKTTPAPGPGSETPQVGELPPNLRVELTHKGLQFLTRTLQKAAERLMSRRTFEDAGGKHNNSSASPPPTEAQTLAIDPPTLTARFKEGAGIVVNMTIPKLRTWSRYKLSNLAGGGGGAGFSNATSKIRDVVSDMLVRVKPSQTLQPLIDLSHCSVNMSHINESIDDQSLRQRVRGLLRRTISSRIPKAVCDLARLASTSVNAAFLNWGHQLPELLHGRSQSFLKKLDMALLCGHGSGVSDFLTKVRRWRNAFDNVTQAVGGGMLFDVKMRQEPKYTVESMVMDVHAGFGNDTAAPVEAHERVAVEAATVASAARSPDKDKDVCFGVSDSLVNSFFDMAHKRHFFNTLQNMSLHYVPDRLRQLVAKLLPGNFTLLQRFEALVAPRINISPQGANVKAKLKMNLGAVGGGTSKKLIEATADVDILTRMFVDKHAVKANLSLGPAPRVKLENVFLTGLGDSMAADTINKALSKTVWPFIERRYNQLMGLGVALPTPCGLSFLDPQIVNTDGKVSVCSDFLYDLHSLFERFTSWSKIKDDKKAAAE